MAESNECWAACVARRTAPLSVRHSTEGPARGSLSERPAAESESDQKKAIESMWNKPLEVLGVGCGLFGRKTDCGCSQFDVRGLRDAASSVNTADREPLKGYDLRRVFHLGWADAGPGSIHCGLCQGCL